MNNLYSYLQTNSPNAILKIIGLSQTILLGFLSLIWSHQIAPVLGYEKKLSTLGSVEFKATYGGLFVEFGIGFLILFG